MNEESKNWFRISKLLIEVGADVLQRLVVDNIQTSFLNELVACWLGKVDKVKKKNYVKKLWNMFKLDLTDMDKTYEIHLRPLHKSWKLRETQNPTLSEQVFTLQKWKHEIINMDKSLHHNETSHNTKTLFWLEKVHDFINFLNFLSTENLQNLNICFLDLCQQSRTYLLKKIISHYDDFMSSSTDKALQWDTTSKKEMKDHLTNLESDRKKMLESWKNVSESFVKSLGQQIKAILVSLERRAPRTSLLNKFCSDLKTIADEIDGTELQNSCDAWHEELQTLIDKWLVTTESVLPSSHICTSNNFFQEIKSFPSISSKQVNDFFLSKIRTKELKQLKKSKLLSEEQYGKISNLHDLQQFDSTLLFIVLRTFLLHPPTYGWSEEPEDFDLSVSAEIVRLRSFRNDIIECCEKASINQSAFDTLWLSVQNVLCRLAAGSGNEYERNVSGKVDYLKTCSFSPDRERELNRILDWCRNDILAEFKGLAQTHRCLYILDSVQKAETARPRRKDKERRMLDQQEAMNRLLQEQERLRMENEAMNRQLKEKDRQLQEKERQIQKQEEEKRRQMLEAERFRNLYEELLEQQQKQERSRKPQEEESSFPTTIAEGASKGWDVGLGPVSAVGGAVLGAVGGIGRTIFKSHNVKKP